MCLHLRDLLRLLPSVRWGVLLLAIFALPATRARAATPTDLAIKVTNASFKVGTNGVYTVTVTNLGSGVTDAPIDVLDSLPAGLSFVSGGSSDWTCVASGASVDCTRNAALDVGASTSFKLTVFVCTAAYPTVTNRFTVTYFADTNSTNNAANRATTVKSGVCVAPTATTTATPVTPGPSQTPMPTSTPTMPTPVSTDLTLSKTVAGAFTTGTNGVYTLTVSNLGPAATNTVVTVIDSLPSGLAFVSATGAGWSCSASGQTVTCTTPGPLAATSSTSILLTVSVGSGAYPTVTNVATVSYAGDPDTSNNSASRPTTVKHGTTTPSAATATATSALLPTATATPTRTATPGNAAAADLSLTKTIGTTFTVGANASYLLTVSNLGPGSTTAPITVTDTLPTGLGFVSGAGAGWGCSASGQTVICVNAGALAAGSASSLTLTVSVGSTAYPSVTNTASAAYAGDTNGANNTAARPTTIRQ